MEAAPIENVDTAPIYIEAAPIEIENTKPIYIEEAAPVEIDKQQRVVDLRPAIPVKLRKTKGKTLMTTSTRSRRQSKVAKKKSKRKRKESQVPTTSAPPPPSVAQKERRVSSRLRAGRGKDEALEQTREIAEEVIKVTYKGEDEIIEERMQLPALPIHSIREHTVLDGKYFFRIWTYPKDDPQGTGSFHDCTEWEMVPLDAVIDARKMLTTYMMEHNINSEVYNEWFQGDQSHQ